MYHSNQVTPSHSQIPLTEKKSKEEITQNGQCNKSPADKNADKKPYSTVQNDRLIKIK